MPSAEEVELLRRANAEISRTVKAELDDFLATVSYSRPEAVRDALLQIIPALIEEYGSIAAVASAEWFERTYGVAPVVASTPPRVAAEKSVRYAAAALWTPTPEAVGAALAVKLDAALDPR